MTFRLWSAFAALLRDDSGSTLAEYALVMTLLSIVALGGLAAMGTNTGASLNTQATNLQTLQTSP